MLTEIIEIRTSIAQVVATIHTGDERIDGQEGVGLSLVDALYDLADNIGEDLCD